MEVFGLALVAVIGTVVGPLLLAYLTGRQRRADKEQDYARQDAVADKVAEVARQTASTTASTDAQLKEIHALGNSSLTAVMQSQLIALQAQRVLMGRLATAEGNGASEKDLAEMKSVERQISDLGREINDRLLAAQQAADTRFRH